MTGAIKYVVTIQIVRYSYVTLDFEFYTIEEAANFAGKVLKRYKNSPDDIKIYISMDTGDDDEEEEE